MYALGLAELGQGSTGERFRIISSRKGGRVSCPSGTSQESSGKLGTGQPYVWCYRAPMFAPPPVTTTTISPQIITRVPTAVTTAVSPQISPILAQQQASPGAGVTGAPVAAPGPVTGAAQAGISAQDLERILAARQAADDAEREAEERKRSTEIETLRREMAERERMTQEIDLARRADEARRIDAERFAREQAEATAIESAGAIPPPPSTTYAPSGGGVFPMVSPLPSFDIAAPVAPVGRDVTVTPGAPEDGPPWALILMAAAGVGAVVIMGGKGKRKARAKK